MSQTTRKQATRLASLRAIVDAAWVDKMRFPCPSSFEAYNAALVRLEACRRSIAAPSPYAPEAYRDAFLDYIAA